MTDDDIMNVLFGQGVDSTNRVRVMIDLMRRVSSPAVFWRIFILGWSECDDTWSESLVLLRILHEHGSGAQFLQGEARSFYEGLPDLVPIFRGCSRQRLRGLSWTTNLEIAEGFARGHRNIRVPDPIVATAKIPKEAIFAVCVERGESELVINPRRLRTLTVTDYEPIDRITA